MSDTPKPYSEALEEAAEIVRDICYCNTPGICHGCEESNVKLFNKGANFARNYTLTQDARILGLVRAAGNVANCCHPDGNACSCRDRLRYALSNYEKAIKGE